MPRAKTKKPIKTTHPIAAAISSVEPQKLFSKKYLISAVVVFALALLLWKNKTLFIVATVNGQPIPRWELENRMVTRYGSQTLDEVINEVLIRQAGQKKDATATAKEIDDKIAEIEKSLDGKITLTDALAQQGMTMAEFRGQVELQLILDKLSADSVVVTDQEVADYIASNSASLNSSDPASQSAEARSILTSQKKNAAYRQLFNDLKNQAKISKFL